LTKQMNKRVSLVSESNFLCFHSFDELRLSVKFERS
jgi:hypothetical protein